MMQTANSLFDVLQQVGVVIPNADITILQNIKSICLDSRLATPNCLFIAISGSKTHGAHFAADAVKAGAIAVLMPQGEKENFPKLPVPCWETPNIRKAASYLAAWFFQPQPKTIVAITGTNGKTSSAWICQQLWQACHIPAASIGTLGVISESYTQKGSLTTPDSITLHQHLQKLATQNTQHVALEASSHGLHQHRLDAIHFTAAAFTNLSRDHLDYHATEEDYFAAKTILFAAILEKGKTAVLNADDPYFPRLQKICQHRGIAVFSFGRLGQDLTLLQATPHSAGLDLKVRLWGKEYSIALPLVGLFQGYNLLTALGLLVASGMAIETLLPCITKLTAVPGRLERVGDASIPYAVYVDYAHTPDALENVLTSLRAHVEGKLHVVFGCGGDRDAGKRPLMGKIAATLADSVIITDDNPRTENAYLIRQQIAASCPQAQNVGDRKLAIAAALNQAQQGDIILVAGKGHEEGQIIGNTVIPYNDADTIRELLQ